MCLLYGQDNPDLPDTGAYCCEGAVLVGPHACTCWTEEYDLAQAPPDEQAIRLLAAGVQPTCQPTRCGDCAYRPGSPERTGAENYEGDAESLEQLAAEGDRFWCHQGMRRVSHLAHPTGVSTPGHPAAYRPPIVDGVPYQADGTPGLLCAGWEARRRHHEALRALKENRRG